MTATKEYPIRIYKAEALYIRSKDITERIKETLDHRYTIRFYNEKACASCEHSAYRHNEEFCNPCGAFTDEVRLSGEYKIGREKYIKAPLGDERQILDYLLGKGYDLDLINKQPRAKKYPMKFLGKLHDYQIEAPKRMMAVKRGVLQAPPRTGKTVMACAIICFIGEKALIVASQKEWLDGFYDTFMGSDITKKMSNLPKGKIGFCKKLSDFDKYAVCLATYQTFISDRGGKLLSKIKDMFGTIVIDEVHSAAAFHFLRVLSNFNARHVFGLTATPSRKDGRYKLVDMVIGRVAHRAKREVMQCTWKPMKSRFKDSRSTGLWANLVKRLEKNPPRLKDIAEQAVKDIEDGHMILIPFSQVAPVKALTEAINRIAGKKVAYALTGSLPKATRRKLILDAQQGEIPCVVGTIRLLSVGVNIPPASMLYEVALSANLESAVQRISRILTPREGKLPPVVRFWMDDYKVRRSCARTEWYGIIRKHFNPKISDKDLEIWESWLAGRDSGLMKFGRKGPIIGF